VVRKRHYRLFESRFCCRLAQANDFPVAAGGKCVPCVVCILGMSYETAPQTMNHSRVCSPVTRCTYGIEWQTRSPTLIQDALCGTCNAMAFLPGTIVRVAAGDALVRSTLEKLMSAYDSFGGMCSCSEKQKVAMTTCTTIENIGEAERSCSVHISVDGAQWTTSASSDYSYGRWLTQGSEAVGTVQATSYCCGCAAAL
jgi:hypothetical protein